MRMSRPGIKLGDRGLHRVRHRAANTLRGPAVRTRRGWPALGYAILFVVLALPWLRASVDAVPYGNPFAFADDARFWVWQLGWVAHAMATDPGSVLQANINHPAPAQLTSSEHLASTQLLSVPAIWLTGNPVLVANAIVWLSYPFAAWAMYRLLLALGCDALVAWTGGLVLALGPLRVPANLEVIHYLNGYLALGALALHRLRDRPNVRRTLVLFVVLTAGAASGYYLAAMLAATAALWTAIELARPEPLRGRFLVQAALAAAAASAVLLAISIPWFGRPELALGQDVGGIQPVRPDRLSLLALVTYLRLLFGTVPLVLALLGLVALAGGAVARRLAVAGLVIAAAGLVVVFPSRAVADAIAASPLRFLRAEFRLATVAGLGTALLAAAFLETVRVRVGPRAGRAVAIVAAVLVVATLGVSLSGTRPDRIAAAGVDRPVYDAVARATSGDAGSILELPLVDAHPERRKSTLPFGQLESEDMVGSLAHWLPLVTGHSGYPPLHRGVLLEMVRRLPSNDALDELVDLTHLRWLLLRPRDFWPDATLAERLLALPGVEQTLARDGWVLARVERPVRRRGWYEAIAAGYVEGRTVLGTPLEVLSEADAIGVVEAAQPPPDLVRPGAVVLLDLRVRNAGTRAWPVVVPTGVPATHTVRLLARWTPVGRGAALLADVVRLRRDVPAGDTLEQVVPLSAPHDPGDYELVIALGQENGAGFTGTGNVPLRVRIAVATPYAAR
jgi:hypothetical protein